MTQISSGASEERKEESQSPLMNKLDEIQAALSSVPVAANPLKEDWQIPVIDLALLRSPVERSVVIDQIRGACENWGFFHVVNHGVPHDVINGMWKAYDTLYQAPAEQRAIFDHGEPFLPPSLREKFFEMLKSFPKGVDLKDTIRLHKFNPDDEDRMTHVPQECRKLLCAYFKSVRDLGFQILETISESLGIERDYFRNVTGNNPELNVSIHRYSPYEDAEQRMGLPVHVDIDILTILLQTDDVEGLEVKKDDRWVVVKPVAGSFVINLGEVIQAITNGKYRSVLHRGMLNKDKVRSSVACFLVPTPDSMIEPIPHLVTEENPPHHLIADWATYYHHHFAKALKL